MRDPQGWVQVGAVSVSIDGTARHDHASARRWAVLGLGLPWTQGAEKLADLAIVAGRDSSSAVVELRALGDPECLVALVRSGPYTFALPASASDAGDAQWLLVAIERTEICVLALRDAEAVAAAVAWIGEPPGMGAGGDEAAEAEPPGPGVVEQLPEPEPEPEPQLEPDSEPESWPDGGDLLEAAGDGDAWDIDGPPQSGSRGPSAGIAPPTPGLTEPVLEAKPPPMTAPEREVTAHIAAEMPRTAAVGEIVALDFRISRSRMRATPGLRDDAGIIAVSPALPVTVSISMRGYRLASGTATRTVRLPATGVARRRFRLEATDAGAAEVSILVRQGAETPSATLRLTTRVGAPADRAETPSHAEARATAPDPDVADLPVLRIDESVSRGVSTLDVAVRVGDDSAHAVLRGVDKAAVVADVYAQIDGLRARLADEGGDEAARTVVALTGLRSIGVDLARRVLPTRIRRLLWRHRDRLDGLVVQTTGEFDVPWELVYVSDPSRAADAQPLTADGFLGMRGATRWVHNTALPTEVRVSGARSRYLCPAYRDSGLSLDFSREEGRLVRRTFQAKTVSPGNAGAMTKVIAKGFDLLHFGGHGVWTADPPDQRLLFAGYRRGGGAPRGSSLSASELREVLPDLAMVADAETRRMVFLNACDVGRMDTSTPGLGGFPEAFLRGGVGILVGCSWAVDDRTAGRFVGDFYEALAQHDVSGAVIVARRKALATADLTALAYVAYAHPRARVVPV